MDEKDKTLARELFKMSETVNLLERLLINNDQPVYPDATKLTNEELGEWVKANMVAQDKIVKRWNRLKNLGLPEGEGETPVAPS